MFIEDLQTARLAGKSYDEIQEDVVRLVNYFTNLWYKNYPILKYHNIDKDNIVTDVYRGLYLRTKDDGLSNLERHFLKASKAKFDMRYMSNLIKNSVLMSLRCNSREAAKKPLVDSLDRTVYSDGDKEITLLDTAGAAGESMESLVELRMTLESIKHKKYKEYYIVNYVGEKSKLSTKNVLDWVISGYKITEMCQKVFCKNGNNIEYKNMSEIRRETINLARKAFYED